MASKASCLPADYPTHIFRTLLITETSYMLKREREKNIRLESQGTKNSANLDINSVHYNTILDLEYKQENTGWLILPVINLNDQSCWWLKAPPIS